MAVMPKLFHLKRREIAVARRNKNKEEVVKRLHGGKHEALILLLLTVVIDR